MLQGQFARLVHTGEHKVRACSIFWYTRGSVFKFVQFAPGSFFQIFNRFNAVEHFAGWKFCSHEIVGTHGGALLQKRGPGPKPRSKTPRVYQP